MKERLNQLFMSKEQVIYLLFLFVESVVYGMFAATFTYYQIGLGSRFYSLIISVGCIVGCIHAFVSADIKKKKWVFIHYRIIDLCESVFFTLTEAGFAIYYFVNGFNPLVNEKPILSLFFFTRLSESTISSSFSANLPWVSLEYSLILLIALSW